MSYNHKIPKKISLKPKAHHGFQFFIFILGFLLPPLAVAARFGIGTDFFINTFLCICGYIPCHFHNFYIQNIRNNTNKARTPKWAIRYGLVDDSDRQRRLKRSEWAKRYDERNPQSTHIGQALEEGEEGDDYVPTDPNAVPARRSEGLWTGEDEEYYNEDAAPNQKHWHYPTNFEGAVGDGQSKRRSKGRTQAANGDRWERTRAARSNTSLSSSSSGYPPAAASDADVPEWGRDYGSKRRSSKNKRAPAPALAKPVHTASSYGNDFEENWGSASAGARGASRAGAANGTARRNDEDVFSHEF
ncbi:hypothetical protein Q5752_006842 [Cryptotrichosporon argae]